MWRDTSGCGCPMLMRATSGPSLFGSCQGETNVRASRIWGVMYDASRIRGKCTLELSVSAFKCAVGGKSAGKITCGAVRADRPSLYLSIINAQRHLNGSAQT